MIPREHTPEAKLILRYLKTREATHYELAEMLGVHTNTAKRHAQRLHELGRIHIVTWHCRGIGRKFPVYTAGEGVDARCPKPKTKAQRAVEYKARKLWKKINFASVNSQ